MPEANTATQRTGIFTNLVQNKRTADGVTGILKPGSMETREWFREKAQEVRTVRVESIIRKNPLYNRTQIRPGFMYLFQYDPKMKEELPYYDRFPLVFPFKAEEGGFLAMNLHYIPHLYRAKLMDSLYDLTSNSKYNETTRLRASYELLNSAARYKYFKPCVKRYLNSHVQSKFLLIPADEWDIALFLPLERFAKKSKTQVHRDSRVFINGI
jgi:hypothetical protein